MHDSSCEICRRGRRGSFSDEELDAFLVDCSREVAKKQAAFELRIGGAGWVHDLEKGTLAIGAVTFHATPIGTFSPSYSTWLWAWANEELPGAARDAATRIQSLTELTGFRVFVSPGLRAPAEGARDLVAAAVHALDAVAFFRCPAEEDGPVLYLAVHEMGN
jgi:hypothetical protein